MPDNDRRDDDNTCVDCAAEGDHEDGNDEG